jgi:DNA adenine methylase
MNFGKPEFKEGPMILKWMGSKRRMIKHIAPLIHSQKFDRYVEPFCGGANVFLGCNIQTPALLCDALPQPIGILNSIRNDLPTFYSDCEKLSAGLFVEGKDFYLKIREQASTPAEYYFLIYNGFNGLIRFGKGGKFNMAFGRRYFKGENIR